MSSITPTSVAPLEEPLGLGGLLLFLLVTGAYSTLIIFVPLIFRSYVSVILIACAVRLRGKENNLATRMNSTEFSYHKY